MLRPGLLLVSPALILAIASAASSQDTKPVRVEQGRMDVCQLLETSKGCSLGRRYRIAEQLRLVLPTSHQIIEADAKDDSIDLDRKLTAQLALQPN